MPDTDYLYLGPPSGGMFASGRTEVMLWPDGVYRLDDGDDYIKTLLNEGWMRHISLEILITLAIAFCDAGRNHVANLLEI